MLTIFKINNSWRLQWSDYTQSVILGQHSTSFIALHNAQEITVVEFTGLSQRNICEKYCIL